jgi:two-component system, NtrC family, sensor kinase
LRFATKLTGLLVLTSVLPVVASGLVSSSLSSSIVEEKVLDLQSGLAVQTAGHVESWFARVVENLKRSASYLPLEESKDEELPALLGVPFRQMSYTTALVLLDEKGVSLAPPVYLSAGIKGKLPEDLGDRPRLSESDLELLSKNIPVKLALERGVALGPPHVASDGDVRIACALRLDREGGGPKRVLVAEVTLEPVRRILKMAGHYRGRVHLVDAGGLIVTSSDPGSVGKKYGGQGEGLRSSRHRDAKGEEMLGAASPVASLGWLIALEQPLASALAAPRRLALVTLGWTGLCLLFALLGSLYLSRGVTGPVRTLAAAAQRIREGDFEARAPKVGGGELDQLADSFNSMIDAVQQAVRVITDQKRALERWNRELKIRVEDRTREVKDALEQVIRSQKLGAVGELGAGLAHELNNPLAAIMATSQLMLLDLPKDDPNRENLQHIGEQVLRLSHIVQNLLRFSETPAGVEFHPISTIELLQSVGTLVESKLKEQKVELVFELPEKLPRVMGSLDELRQALLHILHNAIQAMPEGGVLTVNAREVEEAVRIAIRDTGTGIPEHLLSRIFEPFFGIEKTETHRPGLGLSVAQKIINEHQGKLSVRSTLGEGTEFAILLPGFRQELHLK